MTNFSDITDRDTLQEIIWEAAKVATGCKPRWIDFQGESIESLQRTAEMYDRWADDQVEMEAAIEAAAVAEYESEIQSFIEMGAGDRETAVRWYVEAWTADRYVQDVDCILYHSGMPYFQPKLPAHIKPELEAALAQVCQEEVV